jgi:ribosomal-protein-alanine N-acetyltransferase
MWKIFEAGREDLEAILKIENDSFTDPWTFEMFRSSLSLPFSHVWTVKGDDGRVVAYVCFWTVMDEIHLLALAVDARHRRLGIGEGLIRKLIDWSVKNGGNILFLEVRESNQPARGLYKKLGFTVHSRRCDYYRKPREDALVMVLNPLPHSPSRSHPARGKIGRPTDSPGMISIIGKGGSHGKEEPRSD